MNPTVSRCKQCVVASFGASFGASCCGSCATPEVWLKEGRWNDVCQLAFRYLDVDGDGLLGVKEELLGTARHFETLVIIVAFKKTWYTVVESERANSTAMHSAKIAQSSLIWMRRTCPSTSKKTMHCMWQPTG